MSADPAERPPDRPFDARSLGRWLLLLGTCVVLGGLPGAAVAVVVAAVRLARLPDRLLGALGVLALLIVPAVVVAGGLPGPSTVAPTFVSDSLVPHQLTFAGLALVSIWAIVDLAGHLRRERGSDLAPDVDAVAAEGGARTGPLLGRWLGPALVVVIAVGALAASVAVVQA